jgi:hypothetical protein
MNQNNNKTLLIIILIVSLAGILYFGYRAVEENSRTSVENPFEYDLEAFKKSSGDLLHYSEVGRIELPLENIYALAVGPDDRIYVSGVDSVLIFNNDRSFHSSIKTPGPVFCLSLDDSGDLYMGMREHVEVYDKNGVPKARWESLGERAIITSIAVSRQDVFIADAGNRIVWKYDKSGRKLARIGERDESKDIPGFVIPSPYFDIAIDPDGFLWVVNPGRHSLENYTVDGNYRTSWGEHSIKQEGFCGCCNPTHIVILEDGTFITAEKGIVRIKEYNRLGELVSIVAGPDQFSEGTAGLDLAKDSKGKIYILDPVRKVVRIFQKNQNARTPKQKFFRGSRGAAFQKSPPGRRRHK